MIKNLSRAGNRYAQVKLSRRALLLTSSLIVLPQVCFAQAAGSITAVESAPTTAELLNDEIVVTAQKREQRLQDVGISITALSGGQLAASGVRESVDIVAQVPNLQNSGGNGAGTNVNFSIRGVSLPDFNDLTESPVATYYDEIYLVPLGASSFPPYDISRVEVLRGPQGTLFGRNTTGGIVHFLTNRPEQGKLFLDGDLEYGSYNTVGGKLVANVPVTDSVALRLSGIYRQNDGWIKNNYGLEDGGQLKTYSVRGQLAYDAGGPLTADMKFEYGHTQGANAIYHQILATRNPLTGLAEANPGQAENPWKIGANTSPQGIKGSDSYTWDMHLNYDLGGATLTSVSGYNNFSRTLFEDCDGGPERLCQPLYTSDSNQFSQELRLSNSTPSTTWTVGGYYLHQSARIHQIIPIFVSDAGIPALVIEDQARLKLNSYAAFFNIEQRLSDHLSLSVGGRVTHDVKNFNQNLEQYTSDTNFFAVWPQNGFDFNRTTVVASNVFNKGTVGDIATLASTIVAAKAQLNYKPAAGTLLYASISRGVKAGGFNNGFIEVTTPSSDIPYKPELVYVYEGGIKTDIFDRLMTLNASGFYYDYNSYQAFSFIGLGGVISNKKARLYGGEVELTVRPARGLTANVGVGLLDTKVYEITTPGPAFRTYYRQMPLAAPWSVNGRIRYEFAFKQGTMGVQSSFKATDRFYNDLLNNPATVVPSYVTFDGGIDFTGPDDRLKVSAFVRNMFNRKYRERAFDLSTIFGTVYEQFGQPRWLGVSVGYKIGG